MNTQHKQSTQKRNGFTIIEVVLVLAIAGIIFLMVFVALPSLQRTQRDTQRKNNLSLIEVQLGQYITSNRGAIPKGDQVRKFVEGWLGGDNYTASEEYSDPDGMPYTIHPDGKNLSENGDVGYYPGKLCDPNSEDGVKKSTATRSFALTIVLEGQNVPYCIDNRS